MPALTLANHDNAWFAGNDRRRPMPGPTATIAAPELLQEPQTSSQMPPWSDEVVARLSELLSLVDGWDGHTGRSIAKRAVRDAYYFMQETMGDRVPAPQIVPLSNGRLQLEWHERSLDLEIEVLAPTRAYVSFHDRTGGLADIDGEFDTDLRRVVELFQRLSIL